MAYKVFPAPTGSGNTVFEGDVLNGYTTPDGKKVSLQFYSNDRGYTAANYVTSSDGAKALRKELQDLFDANAAKTGVFSAESTGRAFKLAREFEGAPMILFCNGTDKLRGRCFHRGDAEALKKIGAEFDQVLKTIDDVMAGKGPGAEA
ncbi:MAG: hypothetical protein KIS92_04805 [Planctomycetota bacterium]|nr:hypothetical protein [Planctomycetota bacterium]